MASLNGAISRTVASVIPGSLVVVGSLAATAATDFLKNNVYDVPVKGGDAAYPVAGVLVLNFFASGRGVDLVSYGMMASSVSEVADAYGVV